MKNHNPVKSHKKQHYTHRKAILKKSSIANKPLTQKILKAHLTKLLLRIEQDKLRKARQVKRANKNKTLLQSPTPLPLRQLATQPKQPLPNQTTKKQMQWSDYVKDKNGNFSLRELIVLTSMVCLILSWLAHQFTGRIVPEYIYYSFVSLVGVGCFGYSFEKRQIQH